MYAAQRIDHRKRSRNFGQFLLDRGVLSAAQLLAAYGEMALADCSLCDILVAQQVLEENEAQRHHADWLDLDYLEAAELVPDPALLNRFDPRLCLKHATLPLRLKNGRVQIATSRPGKVGIFDLGFKGRVRGIDWALAQEQAIQDRLADHFRSHLTDAAATRVNSKESCRNWGQYPHRRIVFTALFVALLILVTAQAPEAVFATLTLWACFTLLITAAMKMASFLSLLTRPAPSPQPPPEHPVKRPKVSILVPLFKESEVAHVLVNRLQQLSYPKSLLDVVLILEENDLTTKKALSVADLPSWMRVVTVPDGQPRTKPRAMNYALDFCRGDIVGIFDAEDAPDPDQIEKVVDHFRTAAKDVVCLQGVLDYYNSRQNWLARCFTAEYATWFRVLMPGMARLGFAIPLGGTTLFFRRNVLERLGGWDAFNVTEDADLGFRLARHGYRTEMLETTTSEEANCHLLPWVKQRSRWLKGYMVTYLVHMRNPATLLQQLGAWKFLGFQLHFITALSQFLLAPLLWSCWLLVFGLPHPLTGFVAPGLLRATSYCFFAVEICSVGYAIKAVSGPDHRHLLPWLPTLHLYFPLGVLAAYKAIFELVFQPFYWDKTKHGLSLPPGTPQPKPETSEFSRSDIGKRILLKTGGERL
ncbi:glycosyltransferase [Thalassovita sp.]|uniref:glycosyltransferase n=1 Tax=Thalassovita sp. TaxID=1979401 RepID=UPI002B2651FC|nr:glycosyltransferase [Thalassovita sp.]